MKKPSTFKTAALAIYVSLLIGILKIQILSYITDLPIHPIDIVVTTIAFGIVAFFGYKAGQARNWARITLLVSTILGFILTFMLIEVFIEEFNLSPILAILTFVQSLVQIYALILLFKKESNLWIKSQRELSR